MELDTLQSDQRIDQKRKRLDDEKDDRHNEKQETANISDHELVSKKNKTGSRCLNCENDSESEDICECPKELELILDQGTGEEIIKTILTKSPHIEHLTLKNNTPVNNNSSPIKKCHGFILNRYRINLDCLVSLDLSGIPFISSDNFYMCQLETLKLDGCLLNKSALESFAKSCFLKILSLKSVSMVCLHNGNDMTTEETTSTVNRWLFNSIDLKSLVYTLANSDIHDRYPIRLNNKTLQMLREGCPHIENIDISGIPLTQEQISTSLLQLSKSKRLFISDK